MGRAYGSHSSFILTPRVETRGYNMDRGYASGFRV